MRFSTNAWIPSRPSGDRVERLPRRPGGERPPLEALQLREREEARRERHEDRQRQELAVAQEERGLRGLLQPGQRRVELRRRQRQLSAPDGQGAGDDRNDLQAQDRALAGSDPDA